MLALTACSERPYAAGRGTSSVKGSGAYYMLLVHVLLPGRAGGLG
ncbi:hypothetical protein MKY42_08190 [Paenibacillus sp. FSL W7-1088]